MKKYIVSDDIKKILIIHLRRIGDILLCTPSIREIKAHYPNSEITFLTEEPFYDILSGNPYLDNIILLNENEKKGFKEYHEFLKKIRKHKYDIVFDFYGNPRSSLITYISGAKYRVGYDYRIRKYFYNINIPIIDEPRYVVQVKFDLLRAIGINPVNEKMDIFIPQETREKVDEYLRNEGVNDYHKLIGLSPASRRKSKRWLPERFAALADKLIVSGNKVIFVWGYDEKEYIDSIVKLMKNKPIISFKPSMKESAAILEKCQVVVTNCGGSKHLAVSVETPTVVLCEPSEVISWNPITKTNLTIYKDVPCAGCSKSKDCLHMTCMKLVEVDEVETAVNKMIDKK